MQDAFRPTKIVGKKRRCAEDEPGPAKQGQARRHVTPGAAARFKRLKPPGIAGLSLPVNRLIEVLDHASVLALLQTVMAHHPEIVPTVTKVAPKSSVADTIELIQQKAARIKAALPYRCDMESDYSYIRVKPHLTEFLACISDFVLDLLPPMDSPLHRACVVLDAIATAVHELPNFSNKEFQYTRSMAYEQLATLWLAVLNHHKSPEDPESAGEEACAASPSLEKSIDWLKTIEEMHLLQQVERHNDVSGGKFAALVDFVRAELDSFAQLNHGFSNSNTGSIFLDLISVDYSGFSISARTSH
ncbi:nuclear envelope [Metschnikowia bicuspidata var. bicuspidata NRRL YB-4993]|uniref:Tethering factor for nuclear proteasome STS1 n=1 Tax=Metschnikowia bicuspidata var. bicuspidata NRRL YB-4993 TaxID=869754 RepID=A0A1A0HB88_9ASCO|nr:nuclear envelope [Metschnikowia bicuspidata var. bicuspidata NRRL YB-4993]OBA21276.1 nuclear envelope [Metschnikowia bicuspidata var. bicuspidata NRRL YB-4993]